MIQGPTMAFKYYKSVQSSKWKSNTEIEINSKTNRKLKGLLFKSSPDSILPEWNEHTLSHMYRADRTNCGDWWSLPAHYFTFPSHDNVIEINDYNPKSSIGGTVIVGGGGLIGPAFKQLEDLVRRNDTHTIGWGLGNNMLDDKTSGYVPDSVPLPKFVDSFDLLGIRDDIKGRRWVPCASCMHPAFSKQYDIKHDIVIFEHKRIPIPIDGFPRLSNNGNDIEEIIAFLASGETVITNSYHGAYWAILLGRRCVALPFSSKFYAFRHPPALGHVETWRDLVRQAQKNDNALYECREANIQFYMDVMNFLNP